MREILHVRTRVFSRKNAEIVYFTVLTFELRSAPQRAAYTRSSKRDRRREPVVNRMRFCVRRTRFMFIIFTNRRARGKFDLLGFKRKPCNPTRRHE